MDDFRMSAWLQAAAEDADQVLEPVIRYGVDWTIEVEKPAVRTWLWSRHHLVADVAAYRWIYGPRQEMPLPTSLLVDRATEALIGRPPEQDPSEQLEHWNRIWQRVRRDLVEFRGLEINELQIPPPTI